MDQPIDPGISPGPTTQGTLADHFEGIHRERMATALDRIRRGKPRYLELVDFMIYGMMRIKNEARWIHQVLTSIAEACKKIIILDDHSTDNTVDICRNFPNAIVLETPFKSLDETRDKNFLLTKMERIANPNDYILAIDGDEEAEPGSQEEIRNLAQAGRDDAYRFQILYLWDTPNQVRVDGVYSDFRRASMFKLKLGARFGSVNGGGFHCGNTAGARTIADCTVRLRHYGYMNKEDRIRKYEWYNAKDKWPIPPIEDGYRHMVIGDLLPAKTKTKWAGPLTLKPIS